jgi:type IV pilus assembly protein PilY1
MRWSIPSDITAIDTTDNGLIDRLYVGDMGGRMWRFDISSSSAADWTDEAKILFDKDNDLYTGLKIFYPPDVTLEEGYELVYFATGDRAHPKATGVVNRIYAVKDTGSGSWIRENDLIDVTEDCLQDDKCHDDKEALRNQILNGKGWYIRLEDNDGEKVLASPLVFAGVAYFTTFTPLGTKDPCVYNEGVARLYALDYRTAESVLNYDTSDEALGKTDRSLVIGSAIPSRLVVSIIKGELHGYIGVRGGILNPEIVNRTPLVRIFWREMF